MDAPIFDKQAEQSVLGALLLDNSVAYKAREIKSDLFYFDAHKEIFKAMVSLLNQNKVIDLVLLKGELEKRGTFEMIGLNYITSLTSIIATTRNIDFYIKILKDKFLIREIKRQAEEILNNIGAKDITELQADVEELKSITLENSSAQSSYVDAADIAIDFEEYKNISTGFKKLDWVLDGFRYGTLTVLSGKPGAGKSTIINQFLASAIDSGERAMLYSGELPAKTVMDWFRKCVVSECDIKHYQTEYGAKFDAPSERATELIRKWIKGNLFIYSEDVMADEKHMCSVIEYLWLKQGVRMFVIDNLMTLNLDNKNDKYEAQKVFVRNLKELAKKYKLVIILVAHPKKTKDENVDMFDVSGASEIINLCDYELFLNRKVDDEKNTDETYLTILKNRATGKVNCKLRLKFSERRKRLYHPNSKCDEELERVYKYDLDKLLEQGELDDIAPF